MAGQGRFGNDSTGPYRRDQVVPADHTLAVLRQMDQQVEDLGGRCHNLGCAKQFAPVQVEHAVVKH
ncbi:hypothetical protein D3C84_978120 [compost metagenome]